VRLTLWLCCVAPPPGENPVLAKPGDTSMGDRGLSCGRAVVDLSPDPVDPAGVDEYSIAMDEVFSFSAPAAPASVNALNGLKEAVPLATGGRPGARAPAVPASVSALNGLNAPAPTPAPASLSTWVGLNDTVPLVTGDLPGDPAGDRPGDPAALPGVPGKLPPRAVGRNHLLRMLVDWRHGGTDMPLSRKLASICSHMKFTSSTRRW